MSGRVRARVRRLTFDAEGADLGKVVVVNVGIYAEQSSKDRLHHGGKVVGKGNTCFELTLFSLPFFQQI